MLAIFLLFIETFSKQHVLSSTIKSTVNLTIGKENTSYEVVFDLTETEIEEIKKFETIFKVKHSFLLFFMVEMG